MANLTKVQQSIEVLRFIMKKRKAQVDKISRLPEPTEAQKIFVGEEIELTRAIGVLVKRYEDDLNKNLGKMPPQATDLEEAVLGAAMLESTAIPQVLFLTPEHFYAEAHKVIWTAILALIEKQLPVDMRTIVTQLRRSGELEKVGGAHYIAELTSRVSSAANIAYHARIVVEMAVKRRLITLAGTVMMEGYEDTKDCFDLQDEVEAEIKITRSWLEK